MNKTAAAMKSAKVYLEMRGYAIVELNWRRSKNQIDIIAWKDLDVYFVEVVLEGLDNVQVSETWITKLHDAAESWIEENKWSSGTHFASALIDPGNNYSVISFMVDVI